jgi:hypothetical protein
MSDITDEFACDSSLSFGNELVRVMHESGKDGKAVHQLVSRP